MTTPHPSLARLVRQHAETSRLMGVDFVPAYRSRASVQSEDVLAAMSPGPAPAEPLPPDLKANHRPARSPATTASSQSGSGGTLPIAPAAPAAIHPAAPATATRGPTFRAAGDRNQKQQLLDALKARYETEAPHKAFVTAHTTIVFGEGDPCARLMFVGEAPGEEEDRTGRPFVGRAGQLLDKMIVAMGLRRQDVYIANVLKTRPPNNATPTLDEARLCAPYLFEQISIISPQVIVTLGLPATRTLLNTMEAMGKLRGKWAVFNPGGPASGDGIPVMPTYHPAYLLRNYTPQERAKVWSDLKLVIERLGLPGPSGATGPA